MPASIVRTTRSILIATALASPVLLSFTGCIVKEKDNGSGKNKDVEIKTPLGGMQVRQDQTKASNIGLPEYPGAQKREDKDNQSADISLGFGDWQFKVKVVKYISQDSPDQIADFYRKAMSRYGIVLQCHNDQPVGTPVKTADGLTCNSDGDDGRSTGKTKTGGIDIGKSGIELKTGSPKRQRIVGIEAKPEGTHIDLVELDLPNGTSSGTN